MNTSQKDQETKKTMVGLNVALAVALTAALSVIALYFFNFPDGLSKENDKWGTFGDFFGGTVNPILGFISFIALITTIRLQLQELSQTRAELKRSADAQQSTEKHLEKQSATMEKQQLENSFHSLLIHHNSLIRELSQPLKSIPMKIRNHPGYYERSNGEINPSSIEFIRDFCLEHRNIEGAAHEVLYLEPILNNYIDVLLVLLDFIEEKGTLKENETTELTNSEESISKSLGTVLSAFITNDMRLILATYSSIEAEEKNKKLHYHLEKFKMLTGLKKTYCPYSDELVKRYPKNFLTDAVTDNQRP